MDLVLLMVTPNSQYPTEHRQALSNGCIIISASVAVTSSSTSVTVAPSSTSVTTTSSPVVSATSSIWAPTHHLRWMIMVQVLNVVSHLF